MRSKRLEVELTVAPNNDSSLPASHLVWFLFSSPSNLDNDPPKLVQHLALKQAEPDRGNTLIGIPAQISEDKFVYVLNDFNEAVRENLSLFKTRGWIDIPLHLERCRV